MTAVTGATIEHAVGSGGLVAIRIRDGEVRLRGVDGATASIRDVNGHSLEDMFDIEAAEASLSLHSRRGLDGLRDWLGIEGGIGEWIGLEGDWLGIGTREHRPRERRRERHRGGGSGHTPELVVEVPRGVSVLIEAASGDVQADGLQGDQRYRTASGEITLRAVSGKLSIEAVSGDVDVVAIGTAELSVRTVSGDVEIRAATLTAVQAATTSGDLRMAGRFAGAGPYRIETVSGDGLLAPAGDVQVQMTSVTGDLNSEFDGPTVSRGRRSLTIGRSGPLVTFRSLSGDLHVVRPVATSVSDTAGQPNAAAETASPSRAEDTANRAIAAAYDEARLRILRSLERGEIDVAEAGRRLATLDNGEPGQRADEVTDA